jgi:ABC-type transport system involved in cytochrome c biogenesis permease subunit
MLSTEAVVFWTATVGYVAALVCYSAYVFTRRERLSDAGFRLLGAAVAAHVVALVLRTLLGRALPDHAGYVPWTNWFESCGLFALSVAVVFLAVQRRARLPILGVFVLPWNVAVLAAAFIPGVLTGRGVADVRIIPVVPELLRSSLMMVHVPLLFAANAGFTAAFGIGCAYLLQERQIRSKHPTSLSYRLPSLEDMDRLMRGVLAWALPLLTVGILLGVRMAHSAWTEGWTRDPKVLAAAGVWGVYATAAVLRRWAGWRGRKSAVLCLIGFLMVLVTFVGVGALSRLHGYLFTGMG